MGIKCIRASAGSGKSTRLIGEIINLLDAGVPPEKIVAFTFTTYATDELKRRLGNFPLLTIKTMHSVFFDILKLADYTNDYLDSSILTDYAKEAIVSKIIGEKKYWSNLKREKLNQKDICAFIGLMKNYGFKPEFSIIPRNKYMYYSHSITDTPRIANAIKVMELLDYSTAPVMVAIFMNIYDEYIRVCNYERKIDYDDMLFKTLDYIEENKNGCRDYLQERWDYVLVDEFQDSSTIQIKLIQHMIDKHQNLFLIGDWKQSIYEWRGADFTAIQNIEKYFKNVEFDFLPKTYRNSKEVLRIANKVAVDLGDIEITTNCEHEGNVSFNYFVSESEEAKSVVKRIVDNHNNNPSPSVFVLARTNIQLLCMEMELVKNKIPYSISCQSVFSLPMINAILLIFWGVTNHDSTDERIYESLFLLNNPFMKKASKNEYKKDGLNGVMDSADKISIQVCIDKLNYMRKNYTYEKTCGQIIKEICAIMNVDKYIDEALPKIEKKAVDSAYKTLIDVASEFSSPDEFIGLVAQAKKGKHSNAKVKLLTAHSSKGLEADTVYLIGMSEDVFPHSKAKNVEQYLGEKRLFYVAVTRAKNDLYISSYRKPSDFLEIIQ